MLVYFVVMEKPKPQERIFKSFEELEEAVGRRQRVYYEVTEVTEGIGITGMKLITYNGVQEEADRKFDEWLEANPNKQWGTYMTGPLFESEMQEYERIRLALNMEDCQN